MTLWAPRDSRYLVGLGEKEIEVFDTQSNTRIRKVAPGCGEVGLTALDEQANELYVMGDKGLEIWSGTTAEPIKTLTGFPYAGVVQVVLFNDGKQGI
jgi:hypothetical protein